MLVMVFVVGFEFWDVVMLDLFFGCVFFKDYWGVVFVGGFSYVDVLDFVKGWVGIIWFNKFFLE